MLKQRSRLLGGFFVGGRKILTGGVSLECLAVVGYFLFSGTGGDVFLFLGYWRVVTGMISGDRVVVVSGEDHLEKLARYDIIFLREKTN